MARKRTDAATFAWEASDKDRARFAGKFKVNEEGCHIWHSSIGRHGYGLFYMNGRQLSAHRIAWFLSGRGEPPAWPLVLDHICRNTGCVNVEHLRIVPQGDNCTHLAAGGPFKRNLETGVCIHGHSFTPENTAITLDNRGKPTRTCLSCNPSRWRFAVVEPKSPEKARFTKWGGWRGPASTEYINASGIIRFW